MRDEWTPRAAQREQEGSSASQQSRFSQGAIVDRFESLFHPQVRRQFGGRYNQTVGYLEKRPPWQQLDFRPPDGADQHAASLRAAEAYSAAEAKKTRRANDSARLLEDFAAQSLLPG